MPRVIYKIAEPGTATLSDHRSGYSWESTVRVPDGGSVVFELATVGVVRITRSVSIGELYFHRSYKGVRNKESRFVQFMFVKGGALLWQTGAGDRLISGGSFTVIKDGASYSARYLPDNDTMEILVIAIPKYELALLLDANLDFEHSVETDPQVFDILYGLAKILFQSAETLPDDHREQLKQILMHQLRQWITRPVTLRIKSDPLLRRFHEIESYIKNNISDPGLGAEIIARELRISSRYLSTVLTRNGRNLREIINYHRIEKARELLNKATLRISIKELGSMVGYQNHAHFSYIFKKFTGSSPKQHLQSVGRNHE